MAGVQVEIVERPVEVGRLGRDEITAILRAICLAQLEPGDLGDRIPLVGRLERPGEQRLLGHRLWRHLGKDTRRAEEHELRDTGQPRAFDHVGLDHQIVVEERARQAVVGGNPADLRRCQEDHIGPGLRDPAVRRRLVAQVEPRRGRRADDLAGFGRKPTDDRAAHHAALACDPDALAREVEHGVSS